MRLTPGDIIPIEPPQHVTLLAGEVPLYRGRFGVSQGRNALKILPRRSRMSVSDPKAPPSRVLNSTIWARTPLPARARK